MAKNPDVDKVYLNKALGTAKSGSGRNRPDVMVKWKNGKIDQYEVPSKTDKISKLQERMAKNQQSLGSSAGEAHILPIK